MRDWVEQAIVQVDEASDTTATIGAVFACLATSMLVAAAVLLP